jgi:hypothetical protein
MSTAPAASGGGGADTTTANPAPPLPEIDDSVYKAVIANDKSDEEIMALVEEIAQGDDARRKAAVNTAGKDNEMPLKAAKRLERGALACRLLVAGAKPSQFSEHFLGHPTALAICASYGDLACVRALLKAGADAREPCGEFWHGPGPGRRRMISVVHVVAAYSDEPGHEQRMECLRFLVNEAGVEINATDDMGDTAVHWLARYPPSPGGLRVLKTLLSLGAKVDARAKSGETPIFYCAEEAHLETLTALLDAGASMDVVDKLGGTALMGAVTGRVNRAVAERLLSLSSPETLRAVTKYGDSAADWLISRASAVGTFEPWHLAALARLRSAGVPMKQQRLVALLEEKERLRGRLAEVEAEVSVLMKERVVGIGGSQDDDDDEEEEDELDSIEEGSGPEPSE